jgi:hypothetical protein
MFRKSKFCLIIRHLSVLETSRKIFQCTNTIDQTVCTCTIVPFALSIYAKENKQEILRFAQN